MLFKKALCKHGTFSFIANDTFVGRSLDLYGEYSEDEVNIFKAVLQPNDVAVEVGSNIGALTVPMAGLCRRVYAFEPQAENFDLLCENLGLNNCSNVSAIEKAVAEKPGIESIPMLGSLDHHNYGRVELGSGSDMVDVTSLDHFLLLKEDKINFIKLDCEGMELNVLKGAAQIIERDRPIMYIENDRDDKSAELIGWLIDHGYRMFWHRPPLYNKDNFRSHKPNCFGSIISQNMLCVDENSGVEVGKLAEVADHRIDPQMYEREFARAMRVIERGCADESDHRLKVAHYANLMGQAEVARQHLAIGLEKDPDHVGLRAVRGLLDLQAGNFRDGWPAYELRYEQKNKEGFGFRPHDVPHWDGKPTQKRVLIWAEQGFGDSIMFVRFMDEVLRRAPNAILEVQPHLYELFETSSLVPQGRLYRTGRTMPSYAYHCSMPSLPATLGLFDEISIHRDPYLSADPAMIASWLKRNVPRIGVCLRGGVASERAYSRDMPVKYIEPIAEKYGPFMTLAHEGQWESYADTAAAICSMSLVLTVDTSVAHLSGALGVPTWLMLSSDPDWRWQRNRSDSPWYPTMRIFRQQQFMDWSNVVDEIDQHLDEKRLFHTEAA